MKDVKDFDDLRWDDGKPTVTDYAWGRDNQTASLIRAYKDEIERLRAALRIIGESCPSHIIRSKDAEVNALLAYNAGLNARAALGEKE